MAVTLDYSKKSTDASGKGKNVVGITSVTATETVGTGASRTISVTIKGKRLDSTQALNNAYCSGSSNLSNFVSSIGSQLNGTERTFCTFKITVNASESGTATLGSSYYVDAGGRSDSYGDRSIRITFNSVSGLTAYTPTYYIYYKKPDGTAYASDSALKNNKLTIRSTGPSKSSSSSDSTFSITGNANGGYFTSTAVTSQSITATKTVTTTYSFTKWNTNSNGTGTEYIPNTQVTMTKNITLHPIYSSTTGNTYKNNAISALPIPTKDDTTPYTYTVTYNANGGIVSTNSDTAKTTRIYTFGGWATSSTATSANAASSYNSAITLYAYWQYRDKKGKVTLPTPIRIGYTFLGWGTSISQTSNLLAAGATPEISDDITYYAIWKADGAIRIYTSNTNKYKMAMVYMYDGISWKLVIPFLHNGTEWKIIAG